MHIIKHDEIYLLKALKKEIRLIGYETLMKTNMLIIWNTLITIQNTNIRLVRVTGKVIELTDVDTADVACSVSFKENI